MSSAAVVIGTFKVKASLDGDEAILYKGWHTVLSKAVGVTIEVCGRDD